MRLRNSVVAELLLIAFVYGVGSAGHLAESRGHRGGDVVWKHARGKAEPTLAGWWFGCVSLPLVQFILIEFDQKWLRGGVPADEALVGSADVNRWPI